MPVNKKGFISVYALLLLLVFLGFATMFAQQIRTFASIVTPQNHEQIDLFILHMAKNHLKELAEDEKRNEESTEQGEDITSDVEEPVLPEASTRDEAVYKDCTIHMEQKEEGQLEIAVSCKDRQSAILLTYDRKQKYITSYVYE